MGAHILTVEVEDIYYLAGLSRRGASISLTRSCGGDITTQDRYIEEEYPYQGSVVLIRNMNSSGNESLGSDFVEAEGRSHMSSAKTKDFFDVALANSRSNSYSMTILQEYLPPST